MSARSYLSIGDVLTLLRQEFPDVTISKIRFLESQGLVNPERTPSGYRKFYEHDVERLRWVLRQQREHFLPLKVIKDRLDEDANGAAPVARAAKSTARTAAPEGSVSEPAAAVSTAAASKDPVTEPADAGIEPVESPEPVVVMAETGPEVEAAVLVGQRSSGSQPAAAGGASSGDPGSGAPGAQPVPGRATAATPPATGTRSRASRVATAPSTRSVSAGGGVAGTTGNGSTAHAATTGTASPADTSAPRATRRSAAPAPTAPPAPVAPTADAGESPAVGATGSAPATPSETPTAPTIPTVAMGGMGGASLSLDELCAASGLRAEYVGQLQEYGLLHATMVGGGEYFDEEALTVANVAAKFASYGIEARHLRLYKNAADREAGFIEQVVIPMVRQRNPEARARATQTADELAGLGQQLKGSLLRTALRDLLQG